MNFLKVLAYGLLAVIGYGVMLAIGCLTVMIGTPLLRVLAFKKGSSTQKGTRTQLNRPSYLRNQHSSQH